MSKKRKVPYYPINQLCKVVDCEHKTAPYVKLSEYLVVRTNNVRNGILILDDIKYTTKEGFIEWTQRAIPESGDVLFTREAPAGETCLVPPTLKVCMGQRMVLLRPKKDLINPHFLSFYLTTGECRREIDQYIIGSTVTRINIDDILKIKIFCPSIAEQEKIASFLGAIDQRLSQLRRKHELLQTYKRGVMQKIFSQEVRFKGAIGSEFPDWEKKKLGDMGKFTGGGTPDTSNQEYWSGDIPWISSSDISENSIHHISVTRFINEKAIKESATKIITEPSILLVSRVGVGKLAISYKSVCTSQDFSNFTPYQDNIIFLAYLLSAKKNKLLSISQGTSIKGFTIQDLGLLKLTIPPIKEQEKIADFLIAIDQKIEAVARQSDRTEQFKKGLLQKMFV